MAQQAAAATTPPAFTSSSSGSGTPSSIGTPPSVAIQQQAQNQQRAEQATAALTQKGGGAAAAAAAAASSASAQGRRRRWYLGIQSKKEPAHVMTEVYKALAVIGCEWHIIDSYRIKCRCRVRNIFVESTRAILTPFGQPPVAYQDDTGESIMIFLSLYKVQTSIYLLDFQKMEGNPFDFMTLCARIITELKALSQASRQLQQQQAIAEQQLAQQAAYASQQGALSMVAEGAHPVLPPNAPPAPSSAEKR